MSDHVERLSRFLGKYTASAAYTQLSPDASTREYFRIEWQAESAIACVYGESFKAEEHAYIDVTKLFLDAGLPVAQIFAFDEELAVIVLEDLGDRILRNELERSDIATAGYTDEAIALIAGVQAATPRAFETGSVASRRRFDEEKLLWELNYFKEHYFTTYRNVSLASNMDEELSREFGELSRELGARGSFLCHRDFHAANLMIDKTGQLRIIDHQDAMIGSVTYDLVSLLLDRVTEIPNDDHLRSGIDHFLSERLDLGFDSIDIDQFMDEFWLQAVQRCLKAVGTFSYQFAVRGKTYFIPFIRPQLEIVAHAAETLGRFPAIGRIVRREIKA